VLLILSALRPVIAWGAGDSRPETDRVLSRGQLISTAVATITSTAISPLLGVCVFGIYDYVTTPEPERAGLPLYSKPQFWIPVGILLGLLFLKDSIGAIVPMVKKPLEALQVLVLSKASLVLIAFPVMLHQVAKVLGMKDVAGISTLFGGAIEPVVHAAGASTFGAPGHVALVFFLVLAGGLVTFVVWLVGHAIDVLVLLSPFPVLDLGLKGFKTAVVLTIAGISLVNPRAGLAVSLVVIAVCVWLFSRAFRLALLGTLFAWDLIRLLLHGDHHWGDVRRSILAFTAGKTRGLPKQTLGQLSRNARGILEFRYRRMGFGPVRLIRLDAAAKYELGRGLLYPSVLLPSSAGSDYALQFRLLPRYRGSEEAIRAALGLAVVRELAFTKGLRTLWRWAAGTMSDSPFSLNVGH
jgi:hypothetical protein